MYLSLIKLSCIQQMYCKGQREEYATVLSEAEDIDSLYSLLAMHEQRIPTADQVARYSLYSQWPLSNTCTCSLECRTTEHMHRTANVCIIFYWHNFVSAQ